MSSSGEDRRPQAAVIGAGSWGTALAVQLARQAEVRLWCRRSELASAIESERKNRDYLPGVELPAAIGATDDLDAALEGAGLVVLAVPAQSLRGVLESRPAKAWLEEAPLVLACKGIEISTLDLPADVVTDVLGTEARARVAMLSGPSFAEETAKGQPTAVVAAADDPEVAREVRDWFSGGAFRVYSSADLEGVQLAGALKNVVAIAAGAAAGLGFGANAQAALITRALAEISRLGVALGSDRETFSGLAGLGDLVLTCTGSLSRNRRAGERIGQGETLKDVLESTTMVVEGVPTAIAARRLARERGVEMPIVEQVHAVVHDGKRPDAALAELLARPLRDEREGSSR